MKPNIEIKPSVTESIYSGKHCIIPLADVQHIESRANGAIVVVMHTTTFCKEAGDYNNGVYIAQEEAEDFKAAWCRYRSQIEAPTLINMSPDEPIQKLMDVSAELRSVKSERAEILEQINNLGKAIGCQGMTAAFIITETVSLLERYRVADRQRVDMLRAWDEAVKRWRINHDSVPSAFIGLASVIDCIRNSALSIPDTSLDEPRQLNLLRRARVILQHGDNGNARQELLNEIRSLIGNKS